MNLEVNIKKKLKNFTLQVEFDSKDGVRGILGASGCGKSMTLKAIAGLITPDEGRIVLNNKVLFDSKQKINLSPQERRVGYLFQNYALFPNMTVEQNIMVGLQGSKREKQERIKEIIHMFRLDGLEKQYPNRLSGGQQQRVALARLLAYDPEVMLLDEPFSALDSCLKEQLQVQIKEILRKYQKTVLMVSHDRMEIYRLCDEVMTMKNGVILQSGTTKEVFEMPSDPITARLIGYRNISTIHWNVDGMAEAIDWGIPINSKDWNKQSSTIIGIHERNLCLRKQKEEEDSFCVEIIDIFEDIYEYQIVVAPCKGRKQEKGTIWTIVKKGEEWEEMQVGQKAWLTIPTEKMMVLSQSPMIQK